MRLSIQITGMLLLGAFLGQSCGQKQASGDDLWSESIEFAANQYALQTDLIEQSGKMLNPKTFMNGQIRYIPAEEWTSGFFPGSLWYLSELTGERRWEVPARKYTLALDSVKYLTNHHDIGFIIGCSFGNGIRYGNEEDWKEVVVQAAQSLATRFRPVAGVIQSWNVDRGWQSERGWECPVIIDNMMNLELLFAASRFSGDSTYYKIAVAHANTTMKNHFRPDHSCWHVVDYSLSDGSVRNRQTAQGYSDESAWARGQAWAVYGFLVCYRETGDKKYLEQAEKTFGFVANHPSLPEDGVPYWDFNAPDIPDTYRDASSASVMASALYEMVTYTKADSLMLWADKLMRSLSGPFYRAQAGENGNFILMHSVGSIPHNSEIDVPLNYADYYYLEALKRRQDLVNGR